MRDNRPPAGKLMDEGWIFLLNTGDKPVVLDRVQLGRARNASPLRFAGAFVAPTSPGAHADVAGHWGSPLVPVHGYRVLPNHGSNKVPVLVIRVGPSSAASEGNSRFSQNKDVRLTYRTPEGQRYVVVYEVKIQYLNH